MLTLGYPIRVVVQKIEKLPHNRGRIFTNENTYLTTGSLSKDDFKRNGTATLYVFDGKITRLEWL